MRIRTSRKGTGGFTLISAVLTGAVVMVVLGGYLEYLSFQARNEGQAQAWQEALFLAEAGVEEGLAALSSSTNLAQQGFNLSDGQWMKARSLNSGAYQILITNLATPGVMATGWTTNQTGSLVKRTVLVNALPKDSLPAGMLTKGTISLQGYNVRVDSYDSSDPNFSYNQQWMLSKAKDGGSVGSLLSAPNAISLGTASVYGTVAIAPGGTISLDSQGGIGSFAWLSDHQGIMPGSLRNNFVELLDDAIRPVRPWFTPTGRTVNGIYYDLVFDSYPYQVSTLTGNIYVSGNASVLVTSSMNLTGNNGITLAPGAQLALYVQVPLVNIQGNGLANPGCSTNLIYYGLSGNVGIDLSGNAPFNGVIYAPEANLQVGGLGDSVQHYSGAIICNSLALKGGFNFHFDENANRLSLIGGFKPVKWSEL